LTPPIYFEYKTRHMHHWYRNMQSLTQPTFKKVDRRGLPEPMGVGSGGQGRPWPSWICIHVTYL